MNLVVNLFALIQTTEATLLIKKKHFSDDFFGFGASNLIKHHISLLSRPYECMNSEGV